MASGRWHNRANGLLTVASLGAGLYFALPPFETLATVLGVVTGFVLSPDLDVDGGSIAMHNLRRPFGGLAAGFWRLYWWPYARVLRHRSVLSHLPIIGTGLRVLYSAPLWIWLPWLFPGLIYYLPYALAGLCLADLLHWVLDLF